MSTLILILVCRSCHRHSSPELLFPLVRSPFSLRRQISLPRSSAPFRARKAKLLVIFPAAQFSPLDSSSWFTSASGLRSPQVFVFRGWWSSDRGFSFVSNWAQRVFISLIRSVNSVFLGARVLASYPTTGVAPLPFPALIDFIFLGESAVRDSCSCMIRIFGWKDVSYSCSQPRLLMKS
jgi:hypothetical protein